MFEKSIAERMNRLHTESAFQILAHANELEAQGKSIIHCERSEERRVGKEC